MTSSRTIKFCTICGSEHTEEGEYCYECDLKVRKRRSIRISRGFLIGIFIFNFFLLAVIAILYTRNEMPDTFYHSYVTYWWIYLLIFIILMCYLSWIGMNLEQFQEDLNEKISDKDPQVGFFLGNAYLISKEYNKAIKVYEKTLLWFPNHDLILSNLGEAYRKAGRYNKSIKALKKSLDINTRNSKSWYNLAKSYYKIKKYNEALHACERSLEIEPNSIKAINLSEEIKTEINSN